MRLGTCRFNLDLNFLETSREPILTSLLVVGPQELIGMIKKQ